MNQSPAISECSNEKMVPLEAVIKADYNAAPTLNIDFHYVTEEDFDGIINNLSDEGLMNMSLQIVLANGEVLTSSNMAIYKSWLGIGFRLSASLANMRSDRRSLSGDFSSIKYLVGQFSTCNIKT